MTPQARAVSSWQRNRAHRTAALLLAGFGTLQVADPAAAQGYDCSGALPVALENSCTGDTTGQPDMFFAYCNADMAFEGGEVLYALVIPAGNPRRFRALLEPAASEVQLMVLDQCHPDIGCLSFGNPDYDSELPVAGTFYLVVDSPEVAGEGAFTLTLFDLTEPVGAADGTWSGIKAIYR